jgi:hypothetical protein
MASTIILKHGSGSNSPSSLTQGELAINIATGKLFYGTKDGTSVSSSFTFSNITSSGNISASGTVTANNFVGNFKGTLTKEGETNILTLPATTDTLVGRATNDTFTGLKTFSSAITASIISASGNIIGSTSYFSRTIITLNSTDLAAEASPFLITIADNNGQDEKLQVNHEGVLRFGALTTLPTAITGGLVYSASNFYMGIS